MTPRTEPPARKPTITVSADRTFAPGVRYHDLQGKSFNDVVMAFTGRIQTWYIDQALRGAVSHEGFLRTVMSCIVLDLLSQYYYDLPKSQEAGFRRFLCEQIPEFSQPIEPPIRSYTYKNGWCEEAVGSLDHAFWHGFRCGIIHNGMVLEYGRISGPPVAPMIVQLRQRNDGRGNEVAVNPNLLLDRVDQLFKKYMERLLDSAQVELRRNFAAKFERDFGIECV